MCRKHGDDFQSRQRIGTSWSMSTGRVVESRDALNSCLAPSSSSQVSGAVLDDLAANPEFGGPSLPRCASGISHQLGRLLGNGIRSFVSFVNRLVMMAR